MSGAPKRLKVQVGKLSVSAYILPGTWNLGNGKPICKTCSPLRTRLKPIADVTQLGFNADLTYTIFECTNCHTQWAALQEITHDERKGGQ